SRHIAAAPELVDKGGRYLVSGRPKARSRGAASACSWNAASSREQCYGSTCGTGAEVEGDPALVMVRVNRIVVEASRQWVIDCEFLSDLEEAKMGRQLLDWRVDGRRVLAEARTLISM